MAHRPEHGSIELRPDGGFTYTPSPDYSGTDSFAYRAADGQSFSADTVVTLDILQRGEQPVAVDDRYWMNEDGVLRVMGLPALSVLIVDQPAADLAYDSLHDQLLVSVPPSGGPLANTLLCVDPYTGARGQPCRSAGTQARWWYPRTGDTCTA